MKSKGPSTLSNPLIAPRKSTLRSLLQHCFSCCLRPDSPVPPPYELQDLKEVPKFERVIVPVQATSPTPFFAENSSPFSPKKKSKKKGLPVSNSLVDGYQVLGNGKETVIVTLTKVQVEFSKTSFRSDIKKKPVNVPLKYWNQRYSIFSRFDEGVQLDDGSWYSVTHECIAKVIADKLAGYRVMDGFAGAGGNIIQFARNSETIAVEIDEERLVMLKANAEIYQVLDNIKFLHGDFLEIAKNEAPIDVIFMSPPWGGPDYVKSKKYDIFTMITPDIIKIMETCNEITKNIVLYLPRTAHPAQIAQLFKYMPNIQRKVEIQLFCVGPKVKTMACYMGEMNQVDSNVISRSVLEKMVKIPKYLPKERDPAYEMFAKEIDEIGLNQAVTHAYTSKRHPRNK